VNTACPGPISTISPSMSKRKRPVRQTNVSTPSDSSCEYFLDQESPWMTIGFTSHLHMWKKYLKGMPFERVRLSWGKTETMWVDK
jgi:hypothetical protein